MTSKENKNGNDSNDEEGSDGPTKRQDLCIVISNDRELRNPEQIRVKCSQFTGVSVKFKQLLPQQMTNVLLAIEQDAEECLLAEKEEANKRNKNDVQPLTIQGL